MTFESGTGIDINLELIQFVPYDIKIFLGNSKLMFYKGLVISFFEHRFGDEDIGTVFWNNGTKSQIKDQSGMQWDNRWDNRVHSGIVYMP